ncbi:hypothetical protein COO60DRAFT_989556 [Scenedesmus sp. NREL 46B-D3]|nr:hypothetical protein COO60DRAFT_989556 [Scenedesmus sp. NREL 46B-D3]
MRRQLCHTAAAAACPESHALKHPAPMPLRMLGHRQQQHCSTSHACAAPCSAPLPASADPELDACCIHAYAQDSKQLAETRHSCKRSCNACLLPGALHASAVQISTQMQRKCGSREGSAPQQFEVAEGGFVLVLPSGGRGLGVRSVSVQGKQQQVCMHIMRWLCCCRRIRVADKVGHVTLRWFVCMRGRS